MRRTLVTLILVSLHFPATAAVFIKNLSTGIDDATGQKIANNLSDTDYVIAPGGTGGFFGQVPAARSSPLGLGYLGDGASDGSRWIVLNIGVGTEGFTVAPGTYLFQTTVDVIGVNPATAFLAGLRYTADNRLSAVRVNDTLVYSQSLTSAEEFRGFFSLPFILGEGAFVAGTNRVTFEVFNSGSGPDPMALRLEGAVVAAPEPSAAFLSSVLLAVFALRRQRRGPLNEQRAKKNRDVICDTL